MRACWMAVALSALASTAWANDGRDRYRGPTPTELHLFDPPASESAGYRFLPADSEGGADGDAAYRWASGLAVALVRVAAAEVASALGPGEHPMAIFDLSAENGDTPVTFSADAPPRGRHPGGSHDGGLNLDLGYYLTDLTGRRYSPDYAACTDHFDGEEDLYQCAGPPDRLDVDRQALLLLELARIHHDDLEDGLIEEIGIDGRIRVAVTERLRRWARARTHRASRTLVAELERRMTSDRFEGWARSHHHHIHLRLQRLALLGPSRPAVEALLDRERRLDETLAQGEGLSLGTRVRSYGLSRSVELRLLRAGAPRSCEYRIDRGEWTPASPEEPGFRHVLDLEGGASRRGRTITLQARVVPSTGDPITLTRRLALPRQEPELWIEVDPARIRVARRRVGPRVELWLDAPAVYDRYITAVDYEVVTGDERGALLRTTGAPASGSRRFLGSLEVTPGRSARALGRATIVLSGRLRLRLPFSLP